ncbi:MAG TPA: DUF2911 domain-containing protein [Rhodothermales bacterium]|nr:DUF2911 domain-containing protein [Rhodothermales bacterium]HRR09238.1 DUF2911 domain-containing protein [Rhodothermales bacterium]
MKPYVALTICWAYFVLFSACTNSTDSPALSQPDKKSNSGETAKIPPRDNSDARMSPNAMIAQNVGKTVITISYGRPGVKGRKIFGGLEAYGEVWRTGANESTVFSTPDDVLVNGQLLKKGIYALFVIPTETEWILIFNRKSDQWGAFNYNKNDDALRLNIRPEQIPSVEWMTFSFDQLTENSAVAALSWETMRLPFRIESTR